MRWWLFVLSGILACGTAGRDPHGSSLAPAGSGSGAASATSITGPEPLGEAPARSLLAERFRAAGLHVRLDVGLVVAGEAIVADGFDPEREIGFEYVGKGDVPVSRAVRAAAPGPGPRLLILDPCDEDALRAAADRFLAPNVPPSH